MKHELSVRFKKLLDPRYLDSTLVERKLGVMERLMESEMEEEWKLELAQWAASCAIRISIMFKKEREKKY